jgi:hypothetical protein
MIDKQLFTAYLFFNFINLTMFIINYNKTNHNYFYAYTFVSC